MLKNFDRLGDDGNSDENVGLIEIVISRWKLRF